MNSTDPFWIYGVIGAVGGAVAVLIFMAVSRRREKKRLEDAEWKK